MVAIKHISVRGLSPAEQAEGRGWLAREAGLLSSLGNPLLPDLIAAFSEGDEHYVVMPFLEGKTLKEHVVQSGPVPLSDLLRWARALINLLVHLHGQDPPIIHRDLKPDNILIRPDGTLMVLDLGVARPLIRGMSGTAIGTPGYAAPEQYQGLADERSDLYALGATLHYMLTGYDAEHEAPFRHPPVRQLNPALGPVTEAFVGWLLCLAPNQRPQSARILQETFATFETVGMHSTIVGNYVWLRHRLMTRVLPMVLIGLGLFAIDTAYPSWLLSGIGSGAVWAVAGGCFASTARALDIPIGSARMMRDGTSRHRRGLQFPVVLAVFALVILYMFTVPLATQWILLPALLVLPLGVIAFGRQLADTRLRRARRSLEAAMNVRLP